MPVRKVLVMAGSIGLVLPAPAVLARDHIGGFGLAGYCRYTAVTTLSGQMQYTIDGVMTAVSAYPLSAQPVSTRVICRLVSPQQPFPGSPPTLTWVLDARLSGGVSSATADPNTPPTTPAWPRRPVTICLAGVAEFGPSAKTIEGGPVCSDLRMTARDEGLGVGAQTDLTGTVAGCFSTGLIDACTRGDTSYR